MKDGHDKNFLARLPNGNELDIAHAENGHLIDTGGNRYIDFLSSWCVGNEGWSNKAIRNAISYFDGPAYVSPHHYYGPAEQLAAQLAEVAPGKLEVSFRATGGTEAVEIALQLAMIHTKRRKFVSVKGCYHGNSIATSSIADSDKIPNHLPGCRKIAAPLDGKAAGKLETILKNRDVAAFIMEPIICNLAVHIPDHEFMTEAQRLCRKYGTLLIVDEVATGFYRTGRMFACEHYDLEPDIMCLAKAITGGYAPMGAAIATRAVAQSAEREELEIYSTYGWHPLSVAAALANLDYLRQHKGRLLRNIAAAGFLIEDRLSVMEFRKQPEIRRAGLAIAVEAGNEDYVSALKNRCKEAGLLLSADKESLVMFPPLNIKEQTVHEALDILEHCVAGLSSHSRKYRRESRPHA